MSSTVRITKEFKFKAGHALFGHDGLCKNVHGHGYNFQLHLLGGQLKIHQTLNLVW